MRCLNCQGSGKIIGGGFVTVDCKYCKGTGVKTEETQETETKEYPKIDKRSKSYKDAIQKLMDAGLDKEQAEEAFFDEYYRD